MTARKHRPLVLLILDGWGHRKEKEHNAIALARTPTLDGLAQAPQTLLNASEEFVGLPAGQMGNSEVGHLTIGCGRVISQSLPRINEAIESGEFQKNPVLLKALAQSQPGRVHILGLLSPGGIHSHEKHLACAVEMAAKNGGGEVFIHAFLDGRDTPPNSAEGSLRRILELCERLEKQYPGRLVRLASISGRYYAMDRDKRWERTEKVTDMLCKGKFCDNDDPLRALAAAYGRGESDEFVHPCLMDSRAVLRENDTVLFMNFRADRARQLCRRLLPLVGKQRLITLTPYADDIDTPCLFPDTKPRNTLGQWLSKHELSQLRIAETEKYAHVTFFLNGGREKPFEGEERILVPSPKVATYDLKPEMSAPEITDELVRVIEKDRTDVIICNYANGDMVGHTGIESAAISAVETVDHCIGRICRALKKTGGECLITSDHGNCEQVYAPENGQPHTAHTCELVPFIYVGPRPFKAAEGAGSLCDVAPTMLKLLNLPMPEEMTGNCLLQPK